MSWHATRLGDVLTLKRGHDLPDSERKDGEVPIVSSSGITGHHSEPKAKAPGVVTGRYGTLGEVFYVEEDYWPLNTALYVTDFKGNHPRFVAYFLQSVLRSYQSDKAAVPGVNRNVIHKLKVQCPDKKSQERIAEILFSYDDLIDTNRRRIQLLQESARLLFREWFVYFKFPSHEKVKIVDGVPEVWKREKLNKLVSFLGGHAFKSTSYKQEGKYGIVTIKNVQQGSFIAECTDYLDETPNAMKKHCFLSNGDILISLTGNVGRVCLVYGENYLLNQRVAKIESKNKTPKSFIYWLFDNPIMQKRIENLSYGSAQQNLSPTLIQR